MSEADNKAGLAPGTFSEGLWRNNPVFVMLLGMCAVLAVTEQESGPWSFSQTLRLDNVFDRKHVAAVIIGDRNGRYYEAGPGRNVYGGVQASYRF